jgi:hypothetical protein
MDLRIFWALGLAIGLLMIVAGIKGCYKSRAESYDRGSFALNIWGSIAVLIIGILLVLYNSWIFFI